MRKASILILEDNLKVLAVLLDRLAQYEQQSGIVIEITVLSDSEKVERYINADLQAHFDIILLDYSCKFGAPFHVLEIQRLGPQHVIAISSVVENNDDAKRRGVDKVVLKNFGNLEEFASAVLEKMKEMTTQTHYA